MEKQAIRGMARGGECVGLQAAMSIVEPLTQMLLDATHHSVHDKSKVAVQHFDSLLNCTDVEIRRMKNEGVALENIKIYILKEM